MLHGFEVLNRERMEFNLKLISLLLPILCLAALVLLGAGVLLGRALARTGRSPSSMRRVPLADMLTAVGDEIRAAHDAAQQRKQADLPPVMQFEEAVFEFAVETEREAGVESGDLRLFVVNLNAGYRQTNTNTVTVTYKKLGENSPEQDRAFEAQLEVKPGEETSGKGELSKNYRIDKPHSVSEK
jgi:hypothetical protein